MAMLAMVAGLLELRLIDSRSEAMRIAAWHMMVMATAWVCFLLALALCRSLPELRWPLRQRSVLALPAAGVGFLLMSVGGWLGGRLVYEFGIGAKSRVKS